ASSLFRERVRIPHVANAIVLALAVAPLTPNLARFDMSRNRIGIAYAHDLVRSAPDGALVLLTGDMPAHAALYACGVEQSCGQRLVLSPGQLFMPWKAAQVRRRYPDLEIMERSDGGIDLAGTVEGQLARRPVFIHPELLQKKPE